MSPPAIDPEIIGNLQALDPDGDGFFQEVVSTFLANTAPQIETLKEACAAGDPHLVERAAHKLKGGCAAIGATGLSRMCADLERLARTGVLPCEATTLREILAEYERCGHELREMLST